MTTFLASVNDIVEANPLILVRRVSIPDSSDPLIIINSAPISLHSALAIVVLPTPAEPVNKKLGSSPCSTYWRKVSFNACGKTQSSIFCGRYFSTHKNISSRLSIIYHSKHNKNREGIIPSHQLKLKCRICFYCDIIN